MHTENGYRERVQKFQQHTVLNPPIQSVIDDNKVTAVPNGAAVYIPKHVTYPRTHLRTFLKTINARIVRDPEKADIAVFDPLWLRDLNTDLDSAHIVAYDLDTDEEIEGIVSKHNQLLKSVPYYKLNYVESYPLEWATKKDITGFENLIDTLKFDLDWISYDDLHKQEAGGSVMSFDIMQNLARTMVNTNYHENAEMFLGAMSRYHYADNLLQLTVLLLVIRLRCMFQNWDVKPLFRSAYYYNLLERVPKLLNMRLDRNLPVIYDMRSRYSIAYSGSSVGYFETALRWTHSAFYKMGMPFPKEYIKYYLLNGYKSSHYTIDPAKWKASLLKCAYDVKKGWSPNMQVETEKHSYIYTENFNGSSFNKFVVSDNYFVDNIDEVINMIEE